MNTATETDILRLAVAAGVNVYAGRYLARLVGLKPDYGTALAVASMLYVSKAPPPENPTRAALLNAAQLLTAPGSAVVSVLAQTTEPPKVEASTGTL